MEYTFLIISTRNGRNYARKIGSELVRKGQHYKLAGTNDFKVVIRNCPIGSTLIHSRVAYPFISASRWLAELVSEKNIPIINTPKTLMLTSNKLACNNMLRKAGLDAVISAPLSKFVDNLNYKVEESFDMMVDEFGTFVIKPIVSSGGKNVFRFNFNEFLFFKHFVENFEVKDFFVQPYINLVAMKRVIVIDNEAQLIGFEDRRDPRDANWKLSVCVNGAIKTSFLTFAEVTLAEKVQKAVGGVINFIDIMETDDRVLKVSEVNTSCNLTLHDRLVDGSIATSIASCLIKKAKENY